MASQQFTSIFTAEKINIRLEELMAESQADHEAYLAGELSQTEMEERALLREIALGNISLSIQMMGGEGDAD